MNYCLCNVNILSSVYVKNFWQNENLANCTYVSRSAHPSSHSLYNQFCLCTLLFIVSCALSISYFRFISKDIDQLFLINFYSPITFVWYVCLNLSCSFQVASLYSNFYLSVNGNNFYLMYFQLRSDLKGVHSFPEMTS